MTGLGKCSRTKDPLKVSGREFKVKLVIVVACFFQPLASTHCSYRAGGGLYRARVKVLSGHYY